MRKIREMENLEENITDCVLFASYYISCQDSLCKPAEPPKSLGLIVFFSKGRATSDIICESEFNQNQTFTIFP